MLNVELPTNMTLCGELLVETDAMPVTLLVIRPCVSPLLVRLTDADDGGDLRGDPLSLVGAV